MNDYFETNKKWIHNFLTLLAIMLATYIFFHFLFPFITPFFIGWLFSLLFLPLVNLLENKWKVPRWIGTLLSIFLLLGLFFIIILGAWNKLFREAQLFYKNLPDYIEMVRPAFHNFTAYFEKMVSTLPLSLQKYLELSKHGVSDLFSPLLQNGSNFSVQILRSIPHIFMIIIIALISSYFFTKDHDMIATFVSQHLPTDLGTNYTFAKSKLKYSFTAYLKTQLILMIYTFLICLIGLLVLGSPYTFLLSVIISIIDAVPFFGSGFILWPGAVLQLATGNTALAVGYIVIYLCVNLVRQIMQPKILGTQIGLHPLLTLISMYIGLKSLGIFGMILGPIVAVLIKSIYEVKSSTKQLEDSAK